MRSRRELFRAPEAAVIQVALLSLDGGPFGVWGARGVLLVDGRVDHLRMRNQNLHGQQKNEKKGEGLGTDVQYYCDVL